MGLFDDAQAVARDHVDGRYEQLRQEITRLQAELDTARQQIVQRDQTIATQQAEIAGLTAEVERLRKLLEGTPEEPTPGLWYQVPDVKFNERRPYLWHVVPWMTGKPASTWQNSYLSPTGENGKHAAYGGYVRDMPAGFTAAWQVEQARAFGVDGFFVDLVSPDLAAPKRTGEHSHAQAVRDLLAAASDFKIVPMIDANGTGMKAATPAQIAAGLVRFFDRPSTWTTDGKPVVGAFKAEGWTPQRWTDLLAALKTAGYDVLLVAALNEILDAPKYPMFYGVGQWSPGADPAVLAGAPKGLAETVQRGQVPVVPVLPSNARFYPNPGLYDEHRGTAALRESLRRINDAGEVIVQAVTANDYAEGSAIEPSALHGAAYAAYTRYRIDCWQAGRELPILAPAVFLSHRPQLLTAAITGPQTRTATQWPRGSITRSVDEIEVLTLLPEAALVTVQNGPSTVTYTAPAGEHAHYIPALAGTVSVKVAGLEVTSPVPIATAGINDAPVWVTVWSGDDLKVFDPRGM